MLALSAHEERDKYLARHRITVDAYRRMGEAGVLPTDAMRALDFLIALTLVCFILLQSPMQAKAAGIPRDPAQITQEINLRCMYEMGEFGEIGLEACVKADLAAVEALKRYPPEAQPIIDRCFQERWTLGYVVVQQCVDAAPGSKQN